MPQLTFVLPHWLYWAGLICFPLLAMVMVARADRKKAQGRTSLGVGYLVLLTGGFVGLHRFYVRSWLGILYLVPFFGVLFANGRGRDARDALSRAKNDALVNEFQVERLARAVESGTEGAAARLETLKAALADAQQRAADAVTAVDTWADWALGCGIAIVVLLAIDAVLMPRLVNAQRAKETPEPPPEPVSQATADRGTTQPQPPTVVTAIHKLSTWSGEFVAYWSVIAVFVYYYEVLARYVFNSPTNWAHEGMFLMFGMQYLISGAYAYLNDSHVRVDVFYARLSPRGKAISDLVTSVFFFIFAGTMLATGWVFMSDSIRVWEVSFTEWAIQYWPVKSVITLGALLIVLQGVAKLISDVQVVAQTRSKRWA